MKSLYDAALLLRKAINKSKKCVFEKKVCIFFRKITFQKNCTAFLDGRSMVQTTHFLQTRNVPKSTSVQ